MKKLREGMALLLAGLALLLLMPVGALAQESRAVTGEAQLVAGEVYWFDLSSMKEAIYDYPPPGDIRLVPAVYTGTMYAYVLNKESVGNAGSSSEASNTTDPPGEYGYIYNHSLFVTTVRVTCSWDAMNREDLIFGREYTNNGVTYTMRAPTGGSADSGTSGSPTENEFASFQKYLAKLTNSNTWIMTQDTYVNDSSESVSRTSLTAEFRAFSRNSSEAGSYMPVLEPQSGNLSVLTYNLNGGRYHTGWGSPEGNDGYVTYLKLVRDVSATVSALDLGFDTNENLKPSTFATFKGWLGDDGNTYQPGDTVPAGVTQLTAQWEVPYEQHPSLTVGEEYWFDLSGVNKTGQTLNPALPDKTLTWVPFVYMGTVNAYVLNENSDGVTDASDQASQATDSHATYGYTCEHSLFLSRNYLFQNTSATWKDLNVKGLIFGTNMELGGITYRLRAPSGGNRLESITGTGNTVLPDNNEWSVMRKKAKDQTFFDAIRDVPCKAMMQDTAKQNRTYYFSRQWQYDSASSSFDKGNKNNGYYTPVLEIPADADIRPVTVDLGGGSVDGRNLVGSAFADSVSPAARSACATVICSSLCSVLPVRVIPQKMTAATATESIQAATFFPEKIPDEARAFVLKFCITFSFVLI